MPAGVEVLNDSGLIQVGQPQANFELVASGVVTFNQNVPKPPPAGLLVRSATVTVNNANSPIIAIRSTSSIGASVYYTSVSGSTWTFGLTGVSGETCEYWVFDRLPTTGLPSFGLEISNELGQVTYHSGYAPLRIIDYSANPNIELLNNSARFNYPAGRKYAIIETAMSGGRLTGSPFSPNYSGMMWNPFRWEGTILRLSSHTWTPQQIPTTGWPFHQNYSGVGFSNYFWWDVFIVDVTNL